MKQKDVTVCDVAGMAKDVAKQLGLGGKDKKKFLEGWEVALSAAAKRRKNPLAISCPSCVRRFKRLRRR